MKGRREEMGERERERVSVRRVGGGREKVYLLKPRQANSTFR